MSKAICKSVFVMILFAGLFGQAMNVKIEWQPASTTVDGVPLDHVHCYKVFYSDTPGVYSNFVEVTDGTSAVLTGLEYNKTFYFSVKTCTSLAESDFSEALVWAAPVMPDADTDGVSDDWEQEHFQSLEICLGVTDSDGDGVSDRGEFLAGTDPLDSDDQPLVSILANSTGASVSFLARQAAGAGYENRTRYYTLLQCEDLQAGVWTEVSDAKDIPAADQLVNCNVVPGGKSVFYRTEVHLD